ncbi:MAG: MFS transporter [Clostridiales Family XIII bacterium]|jgi:FSR family fosmidomycin resistance protein-like MFS transporter|nr:MFS transporter [Clostridiales Family XIII bacterium]
MNKTNSKTNFYPYLMMFGHMFADMSTGALPAMLPFLIAAYGFNYASAAGIVFTATLISSLIQPIFGYLGDKVSRPWLTALGIFLSGLGVSLVGFLRSYPLLLAAASISSVGSALFHPEGGKLANMISGEKKATGMGIFSVGGNIGAAIGPIITSFALIGFGMKGSILLVLPCAVMSVVMLVHIKKLHLTASSAKNSNTPANITRVDDWSGFTKVTIAIFFRSIVMSSLITFIPIYWVSVLNAEISTGNIYLTVFSASGAVAILFGGRFADRFGFKKMIAICSAWLFPLMLVFSLTKSPVLSGVLIVLIAAALMGPHATLIAYAQDFMPNRVGFASGVSMGLAGSIGGIAAPLIGWIGDQHGMSTAMLIVAIISLGVLISVIFIPNENSSPQYQS